MKKELMLAHLVRAYDRKSFTHRYIFGFAEAGNIYMVIADSSVLPYVTYVDEGSRGQGYSLRYRPNKAQRELLKQFGYTVLCSVKFFEGLVKASKYNRGQLFEKLVTEYYGQKWEPDKVPFWEGGDLEVDGIAYQIKFNKATFTNEKTLMNMGR